MLSKFVQPLWIFDTFCSNIIIFTEQTYSVWSLWIERLNSIPLFFYSYVARDPWNWVIGVVIKSCPLQSGTPNVTDGKDNILSHISHTTTLSRLCLEYISQLADSNVSWHANSFTPPIYRICICICCFWPILGLQIVHCSFCTPNIKRLVRKTCCLAWPLTCFYLTINPRLLIKRNHSTVTACQRSI